MPVVEVKPLSEKPVDEAPCEHVAWITTGEATLPGGLRHEHRKCADCGHRWTLTAKPDEAKPEPPVAVYGGGRIVTYSTERGQYDLIVDELAMVSLQAGVLVVQHPQVGISNILGIRPWLREEDGHADAQS